MDLANSFGIDRDNLTSANALIPVIYHLLKHNGVNMRGSTPFEARNADRIRRWLIMALLNGVFGGTSDNMLRDIRASMQGLSGSGADFPLEAKGISLFPKFSGARSRQRFPTRLMNGEDCAPLAS